MTMRVGRAVTTDRTSAYMMMGIATASNDIAASPVTITPAIIIGIIPTIRAIIPRIVPAIIAVVPRIVPRIVPTIAPPIIIIW